MLFIVAVLSRRNECVGACILARMCAYRVHGNVCVDERRTLPPLCVRLRTFAISLNPQTTSVRVGRGDLNPVYIAVSRARERLITRRSTISIRSAFGCVSIYNAICLRRETYTCPLDFFTDGFVNYSRTRDTSHVSNKRHVVEIWKIVKMLDDKS